MALSEADLLVISNFMDGLDENDIPSPQAPPRANDPLTNGVITKICEELVDPAGIHSPALLVQVAKTQYGRCFSIEQIKTVIDAFWTRIDELRALQQGG